MRRWGRLLAVLVVVTLLMPRMAWASDEITAKEQLNRPGTTIGISTGDIAERTINAELPQATVEYFDDKFMGYEAVAQGKIDAFAYDQRQMQLSIEAGQKGVRLLDETLDKPTVIAIGISGCSHFPHWEQTINQFVADLHADGTLDDMYQRWVIENQETMPQLDLPEHPSEHLVVATSGIVPPYSYYAGDELRGYDIELAYRLAQRLDADVEFMVMDYGAIFASASTGQSDCVMADLQVDDERRESFTFSDPLFEERVGLLVRDASSAVGPAADGQDGSWLEGLASSFEKTFVREDRWQLFVKGILTTLLITCLSALLGTLLGFALYLGTRRGGRVARAITDACLWLVRGMPVIVLLMILYYVVLARFKLSGTAVAIVGFALTVGASVFGMLQMGVDAVDPGQYEAAAAVGYTDRRTFFRIILPQALPHVMPSFRQEMIELTKATSVVGYVTVQDLTKIGDIVRSRTYEAFFPLIAVTVIYFVLEGLLAWGLARVERRLDTRRRTPEDILKGVATRD